MNIHVEVIIVDEDKKKTVIDLLKEYSWISLSEKGSLADVFIVNFPVDEKAKVEKKHYISFTGDSHVLFTELKKIHSAA